MCMVSCMIGLFYNTWMMKRNYEVWLFKRKISTLTYDFCMRHVFDDDDQSIKAWEWFCDKYTYEEMLHSRRPLTLEEWYTEEELKRIMS